MYKFLTIAFLFITIAIKAEKPITYASADSLSYQYYMAGEWNKLISFGNEAIQQKIDFKRLRQRMGYAYFMKADYFAAQYQYEKALKFEVSDLDTRIYLYYSALNTGDEDAAKYHASKLPKETQKSLGIKTIKIVDAVDLEYNYKMNLVNTRSNPNYYRLGINSQLGHRLTLYQAVSNYAQSTIGSATSTLNNTSYRILNASYKNQSEYYAAGKWQLNSNISLLAGYHYLNAAVTDTITITETRAQRNENVNVNKTIDTLTNYFPANMFIAKISVKFNRINISMIGTTFAMDTVTTSQIGVQAGIKIPGKTNLYLESALYSMIESNNNHFVFSQSAGISLGPKLWLNGNISIGNLKNYSDNNGLYVYNSEDETTFRTTATLFWFVGKKITFFTNYGYDNKLITNLNINYNQHSFSGGIIWKL